VKREHFKKFNEYMIREIQSTRDAGQDEYAHDNNNIFANFERVGKSLSICRDKVLMTYLLKHIDGINAWINGHESQREDITGRVKDAIVYLMLLWAMIDEERTSYGEIDHDNG
jgi:hypothetical protein